MVIFRFPSSRSVRLGWRLYIPPFSPVPKTNIGVAVPWSVPRLAFSSNAAAELGEHHDGHVVGPADPLQVFHEPPNGVGSVGQEPRMGIGLMDMGVEGVPGIADVVEPRGDLRSDQGGDAQE